MRILFALFHIEKCMGSSLRKSLLNYFNNIIHKKYNFYINNDDQNLLTIDELNTIKKMQYNVLLCHCSFNHPSVTDFSKLCFSITCVREPVERFFSHYYYFVKPLSKLNFHELDDKDIPNIIILCGGNLLTNRISGQTNLFEDAIENLKYINCIMIQSQIKTDIKNLNNMLDNYTHTTIDLELLYINTNTNDSTQHINLDMTKIQPYMNLFYNDINLYKYILNMKIEDRFKFTNETSLSV